MSLSVQWGYSKSCTVKFHLPFPSQVFFCGIVLDTSYGYEFGPDQLAPKDLKPSGFTKYRDTFPNFWWFAIGKQQWGNAGSNNGSVDVTFPISFTKAVYQIQLTYNNNSYENPTYEIKDTKSFSYWSKYGGDKLWLAIGAQQWGVGVSSASGTTTLTYHLAYSNFAAVFTGNTSGDKSTSPVNMTNVGLSSCRIHVKDDARYYADRFNWFALGFQQWGTYSNNAANFPISFSAVYQAVAVPTTSTTVYSNPAPHVPICTSLNNNSVKFSSYYLTQQQANQWVAVNASGRYIAVGKA